MNTVVSKTYLYILIFLFFANFKGVSQEIILKSYYFEKGLNYESFPEQSHGSRIVAALASNNVTNLYWVLINVDASLLVQLNSDPTGQLSANILLQDYSLDGETNFRDFNIDTLLMPDVIEGNINIYHGNKLLVSQPWLLAVRAGYVKLFVPDSLMINEDKLRVELEVNKFNYSNERYNSFIETTNLINAYYAFTQVLADMLETYDEVGLSQGQKPSHLFNAWEEIQRVNNYVYNYHFYNQLNLEVFDPVDFILYYDKSIRLQRRVSTLKSWVTRASVKAVLEDKEAFCLGFADLSLKYLDLARNHQPYIATGFTEVARIIKREQVKDMLFDASELYDVFNNIEGPDAKQLIYSHFIDLAINTLQSQRYVATLDLLYNANLMVEWFESVKRSDAYNDIYEEAIDGLMSSYLKVATMAYKSETFYMAEVYFQKAMDIYELHSNNLMGKKLASEAFLAFIEQQTELSYKMIDDEEYFKAISLLNKATWISEEQNLSLNHAKIDSAFRLSYLGIYDIKLDSIQLLLNDQHPEAAYEALEKTNAFAVQKHEYLQNVNRLHFKVLAQALFDTYYKLGEAQMKGANPEMAMYAYLKAKSVNEKYMDEPHEQLDLLIYNATVPVIVAMVEKAEFEVWANRIENAKDILAEAKEIQFSYQQDNNEEINHALDGLAAKIKSRHCINFSNQCFSIEKKAENRIASKKYVEAEELLLQGIKIINNNSECDIKGEKINSLLIEYDDVFQYYTLGKLISNKLQEREYDEAVKNFAKLNEMYTSQNIRRFGISETDVYGLIKGQKNSQLSYAAADYYSKAGNYEEALRYLDLLKQQNVSSKETKTLQQEIGQGLSSKNMLAGNQNKQLNEVMNGSDKWYRYLKKYF